MLRLLDPGGRTVVFAACKRLVWTQKQSAVTVGFFFNNKDRHWITQ